MTWRAEPRNYLLGLLKKPLWAGTDCSEASTYVKYILYLRLYESQFALKIDTARARQLLGWKLASIKRTNLLDSHLEEGTKPQTMEAETVRKAHRVYL